MLLEIPTGLHFTEVQVLSTHECLLSTVMLAEACFQTLVKLAYTVSFHCGYEVFMASFDFSEFPNLQEVEFAVGWMKGSVAWIPIALSTLKPATSPRLSTVQLDFFRPPISNRSVETLVQTTRGGLRQVAEEVTRIEHEFEGAVNLTVIGDPSFQAVFDALCIFR